MHSPQSKVAKCPIALLRPCRTTASVATGHLIVAAVFIVCLTALTPLKAQDKTEFARDVQPLLAKKCLLCHGTDEQEAGLALNDRASATKQLESEATAIVPGKPDQSELVARITSTDKDLRMPPEGEPLTKNEIDLLRNWIKDGADYTQHWSYRKLATNQPPKVDDKQWPRAPIDNYVLAKLESQKIKPSPTADRYQLIQRLYYDLLGLPPSIEEVDRFVNDRSPDAFARLVDSLLKSKHFGERWGRHWLDKARYADSDGYEKDKARPNAWLYRDWVINAINDDMPFDQFTIEQLAGDLLPNATASTRLATAFHRQTLTNTEGGTDREQWRVAAVMDRTETLGQVWLGLSVGCARCHSHKYDQITHDEYYQLYAYFNSADETNFNVPNSPAAYSDYEAKLAEHKKEEVKLASELKAAQDQLKTANEDPKTSDEAKRLKTEEVNVTKKKLDEFKKKTPKAPVTSVRVVAARSAPRNTHVLRRGEFKQPLHEVKRNTLTVLPPIRSHNENADKAAPSSNGTSRLDLAHWLVDGHNPLVPRVVVNHTWQKLFGHGLVRTANDFGVRGESPTHPLLLDYLAKRLIDLKWSRKKLIKEIVMSATYRQQSVYRSELAEIDPTNRLLYRQNRFRVEAEIIRDLALATSGLLSRKIGGKSVFPYLSPAVASLSYANNFKWATSSGEDRYRRGIYTFFKRTAPHPNLTTFDCPDSNVTCITRNRSTTPLGALILLNNATFVEAARALGQDLLADKEMEDDARLANAFRRCTARPPTELESKELRALLSQLREQFKFDEVSAKNLVGKSTIADVSVAEQAAWIATARVLLNLDEFITRD
jgi:hypothetical protein